MIPRYQVILFAILLAASAAMGAELWHLRQRAHQRLLAGQVTTPTHAPEVAPEVQATLMVASDVDGSVTPQVLSLPLPSNPNERARAILGKLLDIYAAPGSNHQVPGGPSSILEVFLMSAPKAAGYDTPESARRPSKRHPAAPEAGPELAVVNLAAAFANDHPSGLETETLTLLSICDTLHANLPRVSEVRFLVDGRPRATLSGHADLTRTYLPTEAAPPVAIQSETGRP
ncbi:MAG TPA: GerMN domain-containing protein [Terracidiphilus sp.]|nr:GerMN domain-containing protein [Terracidiphilus sp.]